VLLDIKHANSLKHKKYAGVSNERILENARYIAEFPGGNFQLIVRVPVIPGFNDTPEEILAIAAVAEGLPGVETVHLLPFHRMGQNKYEYLKYEYSMNGVEPLSQEAAETLRDVVQRETALACKIGG